MMIMELHLKQNLFINKMILDKKTALIKAEAYCAYQERSQFEVRGKLINLGINGYDLDEIISTLIENNFLNESRFAMAYATGKLRIKGWGKYKIKQGLKFKGVSEPLIKKALASLDEEEYIHKLADVLEKKAKTIKEKNKILFALKLKQYALVRGFEGDLISFILKDKGLK